MPPITFLLFPLFLRDNNNSPILSLGFAAYSSLRVLRIFDSPLVDKAQLISMIHFLEKRDDASKKENDELTEQRV